MDIVYRVSRSDLKAAEKFIWNCTQKKILNTKRRWILNIVNAILWIPIGFLATHHWNHFGESATVYLIVTAVLLILALWVHGRLIGYYARQLPYEQGLSLGEFKVGLSNGILHVAGKTFKSDLQITEFFDLQETGAGVYVFVDASYSFYIPRSGVISGALESFTSELKTMMANR